MGYLTVKDTAIKWGISEKGYLRDTCLTAQDEMKQYLDYFKIKYDSN